MFAMVILQGFCGVRDISSRFPSAFVRGVASPIDKVLKSLAADSGVKDSFDLVFLCAVDNYGWGRRLYAAGYSVGVIRGEEGDVKHQVDLHPRR